jgi:hypothetical protein
LKLTHHLLSLALALLVTAATLGGIDQLASERHTLPNQAANKTIANTATHS